jgi:hypothetical protein
MMESETESMKGGKERAQSGEEDQELRVEVSASHIFGLSDGGPRKARIEQREVDRSVALETERQRELTLDEGQRPVVDLCLAQPQRKMQWRRLI